MSLSSDEKEKRRLERQRKKWEETHKNINGIDHKICGICKEYYPATLEYFYKNKSNGLDGLNTYCKKCTMDKFTNWRTENRDEYNAYWRKRIAEREDVRLKMRETAKEFRQTDKYKDWHEINKDKHRIYNRRRQHKNHEISKTEWDNCKKYFNYECAYCGITENQAKQEYNQKLHKEHAIHNGSDNLSNCIPSCKLCNSSKWEFPMEEWYRQQDFFKKERLNKIYKWLNEDYRLYLEPYRIIRKNDKENKNIYELWSVNKNGDRLECITTNISRRKLNEKLKEMFE